MGKSYIMTAFGKDRPGIVADVSQVLYENGCNLEDSTMTLLADEFTLILLFTADGEAIDEQLSKECRRLEREKGVSAFLRPVGESHSVTKATFTERTLHVEGIDQAGIVYKVSRFLADNRLNIVDLVSHIKASPDSGTAFYVMDIHIQIPAETDIGKISNGLSDVGEELNVDIAFKD